MGYTASKWKTIKAVKEALKKDEIPSSWEFMKNFGDIFCYERKDDRRPILVYYVFKKYDDCGYAYKELCPAVEKIIHVGAAKWLKSSLKRYEKSLNYNYEEFKDYRNWIKECEEYAERAQRFRYMLQPGDKVKFYGVTAIYNGPNDSRSFIGPADGEDPEKLYRWNYCDIIEVL